MRLHFIAIGGSVMHSLALALHKSGHQITGSDDHIHEPARSRLLAAGILPQKEGWHADRLSPPPDAVILGMHAKADNPELLEAQRLSIPTYSFPAFIAYMLSNKNQIVIAGSHGKTTITSMLMHIMKLQGWAFNHLVGAQVPGFSNPVNLDPECEWAILEGDEYPSSCLDLAPKFLHYSPAILLLSGISWDHINAFPTFDSYLEAFRKLLAQLKPGTVVVYDKDDAYLGDLISPYSEKFNFIPYGMPKWTAEDHDLLVRIGATTYKMPFDGTHNLRNLNGACQIAEVLGIEHSATLEALQTFKGADKRLQQHYGDKTKAIFRDFAHAPSKVKATLEGLKAQYPERHLIAVLELHTYSSLTKAFLPGYEGSLAAADQAALFINPEALAAKGSDRISEKEVKAAFGRPPDPAVFFDIAEIQQYLSGLGLTNANVVLMSSGTFQGTDLVSQLKGQVST